eukprot:1141815-Pelagomonas_calceolata.AAC.1
MTFLFDTVNVLLQMIFLVITHCEELGYCGPFQESSAQNERAIIVRVGTEASCLELAFQQQQIDSVEVEDFIWLVIPAGCPLNKKSTMHL